MLCPRLPALLLALGCATAPLACSDSAAPAGSTPADAISGDWGSSKPDPGSPAPPDADTSTSEDTPPVVDVPDTCTACDVAEPDEGPGDAPCPAPPACDDGNPCTKSVQTGPGPSCEYSCAHEPIPDCCGNGVIEDGELCDGNCPTSCNDGDPCTVDKLIGTAAGCDAQCTSEPGADPGVDTDEDTLSDCQELTDIYPFTAPAAFNGLFATMGEPPSGFFTSAQCNLFFGDDYGEMIALFDESDQAQPVYQGWEYAAGKTQEYDSPDDFDFLPNWTHHDNTGVWGMMDCISKGEGCTACMEKNGCQAAFPGCSGLDA